MAHGNGFLERGFNFTKQITDGRGSLNMASIKGQKTVRDVINMNGGTDKVSIDYCLLNAVKMSHMTYNKAREGEREEKKKQEEMNKKEANEKRKRDMFEEEEKQWNVKVRDLELEAGNMRNP